MENQGLLHRKCGWNRLIKFLVLAWHTGVLNYEETLFSETPANLQSFFISDQIFDRFSGLPVLVWNTLPLFMLFSLIYIKRILQSSPESQIILTLPLQFILACLLFTASNSFWYSPFVSSLSSAEKVYFCIFKALTLQSNHSLYSKKLLMDYSIEFTLAGSVFSFNVKPFTILFASCHNLLFISLTYSFHRLYSSICMYCQSPYRWHTP